MAQILNKKNPLDLNKRKQIGFGFPLNGSAIFIPTYVTKDQIKHNLTNWILTSKGERIFNPEFGTNLKKILFEAINNNTFEALKDIIEDSIKTQFPLIEIIEINVDSNKDNNSISLNMVYSIQSFGLQDELNILIQ